MLFAPESAPLAASYVTGCLVALLCRHRPWRIARLTAGVALGVTLFTPPLLWLLAPQWSPGPGLLIGLLVALLGWVIIDYASRYLHGEPGQVRFVRAKLLTLAAVSVLITSRHLLLIALAWSTTSLGLHWLLTHYAERDAAQLAARKKFLACRIADACLAGALVLIYRVCDTLWLDALQLQLAGMERLPLALQVAAVLMAMAAILRSAQLPLHGWLIQVMEAPTPVSALLHAGVVNMGGYVLITLAALLSKAPAALLLLGVVGSLTAVLAGSVMMTRASAKESLAWSTCAQMGFMLLEIGLGLYELALLHLLAHSVYKAHAFLSAGETVRKTLAQQYLSRSKANDGGLLSLLLTALVIGLVFWGWRQGYPTWQLPLPAGLILVFGLAPLLWRQQGHGLASLVPGLLRVVVLCHLYLLWHWLFATMLPDSAPTSLGLIVWVTLCFSALYALQTCVWMAPGHPWLGSLYPWFNNGFYLDETITRLTFKLWPAALAPKPSPTQTPPPHPLFGETS